MTSTLTPVGCIGLFGGGPTPKARGAIPTRTGFQAPTERTSPRSHVTRPSKKRGADQLACRTMPAAIMGALSRKPNSAQLFSFVRRNVRSRRAPNLSTSPAIQAAERPASPAAHATHQASKLMDEGRAIRGRVHAVVRCCLSISHIPYTTPKHLQP